VAVVGLWAWIATVNWLRAWIVIVGGRLEYGVACDKLGGTVVSGRGGLKKNELATGPRNEIVIRITMDQGSSYFAHAFLWPAAELHVLDALAGNLDADHSVGIIVVDGAYDFE